MLLLFVAAALWSAAAQALVGDLAVDGVNYEVSMESMEMMQRWNAVSKTLAATQDAATLKQISLELLEGDAPPLFFYPLVAGALSKVEYSAAFDAAAQKLFDALRRQRFEEGEVRGASAKDERLLWLRARAIALDSLASMSNSPTAVRLAALAAVEQALSWSFPWVLETGEAGPAGGVGKEGGKEGGNEGVWGPTRRERMVAGDLLLRGSRRLEAFGSVATSEAWVERAVAVCPEHVGAQTSLANKAFRDGDLPRAMALYERITRSTEGSADQRLVALNNLVVVSGKSPDVEGARALTQRVLGEHPTRLRFLELLAGRSRDAGAWRLVPRLDRALARRARSIAHWRACSAGRVGDALLDCIPLLLLMGEERERVGSSEGSQEAWETVGMEAVAAFVVGRGNVSAEAVLEAVDQAVRADTHSVETFYALAAEYVDAAGLHAIAALSHALSSSQSADDVIFPHARGQYTTTEHGEDAGNQFETNPPKRPPQLQSYEEGGAEKLRTDSARLTHARRPFERRKLRAAFVSFDFRCHPMGYMMQSLLAGVDRRHVAVSAVHYGRAHTLRAEVPTEVDQAEVGRDESGSERSEPQSRWQPGGAAAPVRCTADSCSPLHARSVCVRGDELFERLRACEGVQVPPGLPWLSVSPTPLRHAFNASDAFDGDRAGRKEYIWPSEWSVERSLDRVHPGLTTTLRSARAADRFFHVPQTWGEASIATDDCEVGTHVSARGGRLLPVRDAHSSPRMRHRCTKHVWETSVACEVLDASDAQRPTTKVFAWSDEDVSRALAEKEQVDVFVDLMGWTTSVNAGLVRRRSAPIVATYLGWPDSVYAPFTDYLIADRHVAPADSLFLHALWARPRDVQTPWRQELASSWWRQGVSVETTADRVAQAPTEQAPTVQAPTAQALRSVVGYCEKGRRVSPPEPASGFQVSVGAAAPPAPHPHNRWTEGVVLMPGTYQAFLPPRDVAPPGGDASSFGAARRRQGLPPAPERPVLAVVSQWTRVSASQLTCWAQIMRRHPRAVLWVLVSRKVAAEHAPLVQRRLCAEFAARGVPACAPGPEAGEWTGVPRGRVVLAPREPRARHLQRLALADLALDTREYNGHTTLSEALWMQLPVLTLPGERFASRVGLSLATAALASRPHVAKLMVAHSVRDYTSVASALLERGTSALRALSRAIGADLLRAPLFAEARGTPRHLSAALLAMHEVRAAQVTRAASAAGVCAVGLGDDVVEEMPREGTDISTNITKPPHPNSAVRLAPGPRPLARGGWVPWHIVVRPESASREDGDVAAERVLVEQLGGVIPALLDGSSRAMDPSYWASRETGPRPTLRDADLSPFLSPKAIRTAGCAKAALARAARVSGGTADTEEDGGGGGGCGEGSLEDEEPRVVALDLVWSLLDRIALLDSPPAVLQWLLSIAHAGRRIVEERVYLERAAAAATIVTARSFGSPVTRPPGLALENVSYTSQADPDLFSSAHTSTILPVHEAGFAWALEALGDHCVCAVVASNGSLEHAEKLMADHIFPPSSSDDLESFVLRRADDCAARIRALVNARTATATWMRSLSWKAEPDSQTFCTRSDHQNTDPHQHLPRPHVVRSASELAAALLDTLDVGSGHPSLARLLLSSPRVFRHLFSSPDPPCRTARDVWRETQAAVLEDMDILLRALSTTCECVFRCGAVTPPWRSHMAASEVAPLLEAAEDEDGEARWEEAVTKLRSRHVAVGNVLGREWGHGAAVLGTGVLRAASFAGFEGLVRGVQTQVPWDELVALRMHTEVVVREVNGLLASGMHDAHHSPWRPYRAALARARAAGRAVVVFLADELQQAHFPGFGPWSTDASAVRRPPSMGEDEHQRLLRQGAGGAEMAVLAAAEGLSAMLQEMATVLVVTDTLPKAAWAWIDERRGVQWFHTSQLWPELRVPPNTAFIVHRLRAVAALAPPLAPCDLHPRHAVYVWLHDSVPVSLADACSASHSSHSHAPSTLVLPVTRSLFVSATHLLTSVAASELGSDVVVGADARGAVGERLGVVRLSIAPPAAPAPDLPPRDPYRFIFASNPARNLRELLEMWTDIRAALGPRARLSVLYGRNSSAALKSASDPTWAAQIAKLMQQDGVEDLGRVSFARVFELLSTSGFWLYPSAFQETSCLVAQQAVVAGAVPITARAPYSAVFEATNAGRFDLGPPALAPPFSPQHILSLQPRSASAQERLRAAFTASYASDAFRASYVARVVRAVHADAGLLGPSAQSDMHALRAEMVRWGSEHLVRPHGAAHDLVPLLQRDGVLPHV